MENNIYFKVQNLHGFYRFSVHRKFFLRMLCCRFVVHYNTYEAIPIRKKKVCDRSVTDMLQTCK